jgi:hypothetical protein
MACTTPHVVLGVAVSTVPTLPGKPRALYMVLRCSPGSFWEEIQPQPSGFLHSAGQGDGLPCGPTLHGGLERVTLL